MNKHPLTVVLTSASHADLVQMARDESRPVAQMARVIIERAINNHKQKKEGV